ncbi:MAG: hypothetical protein LBB89_04490 [Treponema sp.]|jgi:hypothetical protein|nr:hypothetical protein [Treponema sp.]
MQKVRIFLILLGLCWFSGQGMFLYAQEEDDDEDDDSGYREDIPIESDWDGYISELYSKGDQTIIISPGVNFPVAFYNNGKKIDHHIDPPVGGILALGYTYFFGAHYFLGGGVGFYFDHTLGQNTVFFIPIGLRTGWQFVLRRFEFPLEVAGGVTFHRYLDNSYTGFFLRAGASAYFRLNPDWSLGISNDWSWFPQRPEEGGRKVPEKNIDAIFTGLTLSARYHF